MAINDINNAVILFGLL